MFPAARIVTRVACKKIHHQKWKMQPVRTTAVYEPPEGNSDTSSIHNPASNKPFEKIRTKMTSNIYDIQDVSIKQRQNKKICLMP
jgi:hypothetical protein